MPDQATPRSRGEDVLQPKPIAPPVDEAGIPDDLKALPRWVGWKYESRKGKWAKPPFRCGGAGKASVTDPAHWGTFAAALDAYRRRGWDGVGFVFAASDPFSGVDLDDCRDAESGRLDPRADRIIRSLDSYTEVSPSGTGVKVVVAGKLPGKPGRREEGIEIYSDARYFTMTGHRLDGTPREVRDRRDELARLHEEVFSDPAVEGHHPEGDDQIIERAKGAKNGEKFARLWSGDAGGYASDSEADAALCGMLAFWAGPDAGWIEALLDQSGLAGQGTPEARVSFQPDWWVQACVATEGPGEFGPKTSGDPAPRWVTEAIPSQRAARVRWVPPPA